MAKRWYTATVNYQTFAGNAGSWRGPVFAADDTVADVANECARRSRPRLMKIVGGDSEPCPENEAEGRA